MKRIEKSKTTPLKPLNDSTFRIDLNEVSGFTLPSKLSNNTIMPRETRKKDLKTKDILQNTNTNIKDSAKPVSNNEVEIHKESIDIAPTIPPSGKPQLVREFSFLPSALGQASTNADDEIFAVLNETSGKAAVKKGGGIKSDVDEVNVIMAGIKTSDDAINFFARFGSETPVKFIDLIENKDQKVYSPYDLIVTKLSDPLVEHYTMSPAGLVYICPGEPSECTALSAFMRQGMMFKILRNIPFYKYFLQKKMYTVWKENVRFALFTKQRKKLVDRLFYARNNSCEAVLAIRKNLIEINNVKILNLDLRTCDKDVFIDQQINQGSKANAKFDEVMRMVITEVQNVINEVNNLHSLAKQDPNSNTMSYTDGTVEKAKSLVQLKEEKSDRKKLKLRAKLEYSTLPDFIRFIDYMAIETLVALAVKTFVDFHDELIKVRKAGVFETMVRFSTTGTTFSPTCQDFREMLDRLLENVINSVGNVNRVSYLSSKSIALNGPNIQAIIRENKMFLSVSDNLEQRVITDFEKAEEHAQSYESVRPIYDFNITWDYDAYRSQQHDVSSLKGMLELIGNWSKELEKLRNKPIGILEVDSKRLKGELNPLREARLQEIKDYIKDNARLPKIVTFI